MIISPLKKEKEKPKEPRRQAKNTARGRPRRLPLNFR